MKMVYYVKLRYQGNSSENEGCMSVTTRTLI